MIFGRPALALASVCVAGVACGADRPNPPNAAARPPLDSPGVPAPSLQTTAPRPWWDKEFGIGVVRYAAMYRYQAKDVIRAAPSAGASIIALLNRDSLCFTGDKCVRSYNRMIEFDYEVPGWAILGFSDDSAWVQVRLAPSDSAAPVGWVALRADSVQALLWSRILPTKSVYFMRPSDVAFYTAPTDSAEVERELVKEPNSGELNHIMIPLEARGAWLRVVLLTPSPMCVFPEPKVTPDTLWIQYLTPKNRPNVFYYTRGC
jgi:hypothetical protein